MTSARCSRRSRRRSARRVLKALLTDFACVSPWGLRMEKKAMSRSRKRASMAAALSLSATPVRALLYSCSNRKSSSTLAGEPTAEPYAFFAVAAKNASRACCAWASNSAIRCCDTPGNCINANRMTATAATTVTIF